MQKKERERTSVAWLEVAATLHYCNHDYKESLESYSKIFEVLSNTKLDTVNIHALIKAVSRIDAILDIISVNLFSYELERLALETKCKGLTLLEEYEEISEVHLRLKDISEYLEVNTESLQCF